MGKNSGVIMSKYPIENAVLFKPKQLRKVNLNKITFRQYMAAMLIYSKYASKQDIPSPNELKETIGFKTDRMLDITLSSLASKGIIEYKNKKVFINENLGELKNKFIDPLLLSKDHITYFQLKNLILNDSSPHLTFPTRMGIQLPYTFPSSKPSLIDNSINTKNIVNRWYNYLEDFPSYLISKKLNEYGIQRNNIVFDPFVGSGTTVVTSNLLGIDAIGTDVNPIASFVSKVKTTFDIDLNKFIEESRKIILDYNSVSNYLSTVKLKSNFIDNMGFIEANQWLKPKTQNEVAYIKERISEVEDIKIRNLFKLALIEASIEASNVSFCPGTSFYPFRKRPAFIEAFKRQISIISEDLMLLKKLNPDYGKSKIYNKDCRKATSFIKKESVDFIITSPPYPNDLEYTRQTRLELFLLDFVENLNDVRKIKHNMVKGSTKLIYKKSSSAKYVKSFSSVQDVAEKLESAFANKNWGWDYPRMVREYFGDMFIVLQKMKYVMKPDSYSLYVVGDQTYKNVLIPVGKILEEFALSLGYSDAKIELFRVRKSTIHNTPLNEEIVILKS